MQKHPFFQILYKALRMQMFCWSWCNWHQNMRRLAETQLSALSGSRDLHGHFRKLRLKLYHESSFLSASQARLIWSCFKHICSKRAKFSIQLKLIEVDLVTANSGFKRSQAAPTSLFKMQAAGSVLAQMYDLTACSVCELQLPHLPITEPINCYWCLLSQEQ